MDYTDFSKTGGFPLDSDVLDFNHKVLASAMNWPFRNPDGTYPTVMVLSGCEDTQTNDFINDGWMFYNGEILPFRGSYANQWSASIPSTDGDLFLVETRQQAVFENGQTYDVLEVTRYLTCDLPAGTTAPVGNIYQIPRWTEIVGQRAAGVGNTTSANNGWLPFSGTSGPVAWMVELRRNLLTRLVYLRGEATINVAAVPTPAINYMTLVLPPGYGPSATLSFCAAHDYHGVSRPEDPAIRSISCKILPGSVGTWALGIAPVKPTDPAITSYKVRFHTVYPLD